jgi:hypothetical protein
MSTFHLFSNFPKELRLKIYEETFEERVLQLGVDAGVPYPPGMEPLGASNGPSKRLHTRLPTLFAVCKESRELCKANFVAFGPTFIHPMLDTLYISLYAIGRMVTTRLKIAPNTNRSSTYPVVAFHKVAIEYSVKDLPKDLVSWKERPHTWQVRHGVKEFCAPGMWPATDYAEFFRCFGAPREVLLVTNGALSWAGGFSKFRSWQSIALVPTEIESQEQRRLEEFLKAHLPAALAETQIKFTAVEALNNQGALLACPYSFTSWRDMTERYIWA